MTEPKTPLTSDKMSVPAAKSSSNKNATEKSSPKKKNTKPSPANATPSKVSKLAIFALLIAVAAPSGHYYWQQIQEQALTKKITEENTSALKNYQSQMQQALTKQNQNFNQKLQQVIAQIQSTNETKIIELDATVSQLEQNIKQRQPSDWLLHEAEYLIRVAARTLWLEHDTSAALGLLRDADARLTELNDPAFLPVREVIHQDIKSLELLPKLQTDEVVLTLMAMSKQVAQLPLAIDDLGKAADKETELELSDNIVDWRANLAKTWQKFLNDFIRVRQRTGLIEPLMSPKQQENLKQNLSLKVQLTLWAASERKGDIYQKSLVDIQLWLNEFFDMKDISNQQFSKTLTELQQKQVSFDYPSELGSLKAIRTALRNQQSKPLDIPEKTADKEANKTQDILPKEVKTELKTPVQQNEESKNEGSI